MIIKFINSDVTLIYISNYYLDIFDLKMTLHTIVYLSFSINCFIRLIRAILKVNDHFHKLYV
jgi:hypothetical protein